MPSPSPSGASLAGISCPSAKTCMAVGEASASGTTQALSEILASGHWSILLTPDPHLAKFTQLEGVSCRGRLYCVAVGYSSPDGATFQPLIETYDDGAWSIDATPVPTGDTETRLSAVSCTGRNACIAVGETGVGTANQTLIERFNRGQWSIVSRSNAVRTQNLWGVSCWAAKSCVAVGADYGEPQDMTLAESSHRYSWSKEASPNPDSIDNIFQAVSCKGPSFCVGVGQTMGTLLESRNANGWSVANPNPNQPTNNYLFGVSCPRVNSCVAVGWDSGGSVTTTIVDTLSPGVPWKATPSPNGLGALDSYLDGVSCPTVTICMAVGSADFEATNEVLILNRPWLIESARPG